jgi:hypothetical protein
VHNHGCLYGGMAGGRMSQAERDFQSGGKISQAERDSLGLEIRNYVALLPQFYDRLDIPFVVTAECRQLTHALCS